MYICAPAAARPRASSYLYVYTCICIYALLPQLVRVPRHRLLQLGAHLRCIYVCMYMDVYMSMSMHMHMYMYKSM